MFNFLSSRLSAAGKETIKRDAAYKTITPTRTHVASASRNMLRDQVMKDETAKRPPSEIGGEETRIWCGFLNHPVLLFPPFEVAKEEERFGEPNGKEKAAKNPVTCKPGAPRRLPYQEDRITIRSDNMDSGQNE
ncbi:hypothetical protein OUZ56_004244 [Daphnia magna]|uniref:Uncharacterized protein n=1 Tax=Daphnia magna TaxID=35525 RepID=A0ABQ9YP71_9CRUS|nr:hypothetical protein OUZ56_004244 [Daphnia magna]